MIERLYRTDSGRILPISLDKHLTFVLETSLMSVRIVKAVTYDIRFPTSRTGAGSDAMNPDPDYSAAYVTLETDDPTGSRATGSRSRSAGAPRSASPRSRRSHRTSSAPPSTSSSQTSEVSGAGRHRLAAALARAGEGRDPPRHRGDRERRLGSLRQARGQAALEAPRRHDARGDRRVRRLPLHRRRPHPRRGARDPAGRTSPRRPSGRRDCSTRASRRTRRPPAGSATRRRAFRSGLARRSPPGSPT